MTLGTGIFLSAIIFTLAYLYVRSDNKARWAKAIAYITSGILIFLLILIGFGSVNKWLTDSK
jgi:hypothetical protein